MAESNEEKLSRVREMASGSETWDLSRNDIAALKYVLSLVREPVASVTGRVVSVTHDRRIIEVHCDRDAVPWTAGLLGKYVDVHAVDAGEEK